MTIDCEHLESQHLRRPLRVADKVKEAEMTKSQLFVRRRKKVHDVVEDIRLAEKMANFHEIQWHLHCLHLHIAMLFFVFWTALKAQEAEARVR